MREIQESGFFSGLDRTSLEGWDTMLADEATTRFACRANAADLLEDAMLTSHTSTVTTVSAIRQVAHGVALLLCLCTPALAQTTLPPVAKTADLSGPRFGLTLLADGVVKKLEERNIKVGPHISQFGWQFEKLFYTRDSGVTMVTEWIGLVGGLRRSRELTHFCSAEVTQARDTIRNAHRERAWQRRGYSIGARF